MILVMNRFLIKGHFNFSPNECYHQNLLYLLNKMIYIYIYFFFFFFTAYGWPVRLEIQNPFIGPKSARGTKG